jgi:hypothetical protein
MTPSNPSSNADARSGMNDTAGVGVPARTLPTRPFGIETALNMMRETRGGNEAKLWTPLCWDLACYIAELEAHVAAGVKEDRG